MVPDHITNWRFTMTKNTRKPAATRKPATAAIKWDLVAIGKTLTAADRKTLDGMVTQYDVREKAYVSFSKAVTRLVKKHGVEALTKGSANPKVANDSNAAVVTERKVAKANPYLRYLWLSAQALGLSVSRANDLVTEVKKMARGGKPGGKGSKSEPAIRVVLVKEPDESVVGIGLKDWLVKQGDKYPTLAAFLLPALAECLGDAYDEGDDEGDDE